MASDSMLQTAALAALILCGAYFAAAETAYSRANKIRLKNLADGGSRRAKRALSIIGDFDRALITVLICTNVIHLTCASLATIIANRLWGQSAVVWSTAVITVVVFFAAEMLPKSIAVAHSEALAMAFSGSLRFLMRIFTPLSAAFAALGTLVKKLIGVRAEPEVTEDELYEMIETINDEGGLSESGSELIRSAVEFDRVSVRSVLTPRVDTVMIDVDIPDDELIELLRTDKHSRLPVYEGTVDNVIGVLRVTGYLREWADAHSRPSIRAAMDKPLFVPGTVKIDELLGQMRSHRHHMAIVTDEYGGVMGIVTVEDILEELVGEIWDEEDEVEEESKPLGPGKYLVSGDMDVRDAMELLGVDDPELPEHTAMRAWALEHFDAMPNAGDSFDSCGVRVEVRTASGFRIDSLVLEDIRPREEGEDADL